MTALSQAVAAALKNHDGRSWDALPESERDRLIRLELRRLDDDDEGWPPGAGTPHRPPNGSGRADA